MGNTKGTQKRLALLSAYDKTGIVEFAQELNKLGFDLIASGGTCKVLQDAGLEVTNVAEWVGGEPILGHRVVTLSRQIHAALLARDTPEDQAELDLQGIRRIDLVRVDLYPLQKAIADPNATEESVIEMTDIGGPTLLRAAAKGRRIVICDCNDHDHVLAWLKDGEPYRETVLQKYAAKAEITVAIYAAASAMYHDPKTYAAMIGTAVRECRYGENAWQVPAALYIGNNDPLGLPQFQPVAGHQPSSNNTVDLDRALQTMTHIAAVFEHNRGYVPSIALGVKHGNACAAAVSGSAVAPEVTLRKMLGCDNLALFGGLVITNFGLFGYDAQTLLTHGQPEGEPRILDAVVAPSINEQAIETLTRKGDRCCMLTNEELYKLGKESLDTQTRFRYVRGGFLTQPNYTYVFDLKHPELKVYGELTREQEDDLLLAWAICATSNSNTITIVKDGKLLGNGVGQQARVRCCKLADMIAQECGHDLEGAVACSDSFFPFPDGPQVLIDAGIKAILTTSGSIRDKDTIALCERSGVALLMIPDKIGRGFYNH